MNGQIDLSGQAGNNLTNYSNDGRTIATSTANFTRDVQEQFIKHHFNPSEQSGVDYFRNKYTPQQAANVPPVQQNVNQQGQIDVNEYNRLKEMERVLRTNPTVFSGQNEFKPQAQSEPVMPVTQEGQNDDMTKLLQDLGISLPPEVAQPQAQPQQPMQPAPVQPGQDVNQNEAQILNDFKREAVLAGVDPNEAIQFVNSLSPTDIITLFKAYKNASTSQPQQPTPAAPMQYQQVQQPYQQQSQPNIVEMPRATSAFPTGYIPQQPTKSIFN